MHPKFFLLAIAISSLSCAAKEPVKPLDKALNERIEALKKKTLADMVFIEGGRFQMGDFGEIHAEEKLPYTSQPENKPLHWVELVSFSLSRYKVTYENFDVYTDANRMKRIATTRYDKPYRDTPNVPAGLNWPEAKAYCRWLGKLTGFPIDLPTEAQWEYAARNRGQFVLWPTDNGLWEKRRNVADYEQRDELISGFGGVLTAEAFPIGLFPPSPLGLYDMTGNTSDWVEDWLALDYYAKSPVKNPRGPAHGQKKVARGLEADPETGLTFYRRSRVPVVKPHYSETELVSERWPGFGARCAVDSPKPVIP